MRTKGNGGIRSESFEREVKCGAAWGNNFYKHLLVFKSLLTFLKILCKKKVFTVSINKKVIKGLIFDLKEVKRVKREGKQAFEYFVDKRR